MASTVVPVQTTESMQVTVPEGLKAGQSLAVAGPSGTMNVIIPEGLSPGDSFTIQVPAVPVIQAAAITDDIMAVKGIFVKQKIELLEVITGFETKNKYKVYEYNDGAKGREMFKAKEESECCERQYCGAKRSFTMNITSKTTENLYLQFERPFAMECYCACRSMCQVKDKDGTQLGQVYHPFNCCQETLDIMSPKGELWYRITPGCCCSQPGLVCQCPCPACMEIHFPIYERDTDTVVGELMRHHPGCGKALASDADHFSLTFPEKSTFAQRASLFAAIFVFDFLLFESKENDNHH